jgi:hypothetical protein
MEQACITNSQLTVLVIHDVTEDNSGKEQARRTRVVVIDT